MKRKCYIEYIIVLALTFSGCIHEYPTCTKEGREGIDPTLVQVNVEVVLDLTLLPLTKATDGYCLRVIVEVLRNGKAETRQVILPEGHDHDNVFRLPINLRLHAVEYTLAVWTDYVRINNPSDLYYNTMDLQSVVCTDPYTGSTPQRDCFYGTALLDLRSYREEWNAKVQVPLVLTRPVAQYRIITTDVEQFIRRIKSRSLPEGFTITFSYDFFVPTGFNVVEGVAINSKAGVTFTTPLVLPHDEVTEWELGHDFVFVNDTESFVVLSIEVRDAEGETVSRTNGIKIFYKRGQETTLRANLLSGETDSGMSIDPDFNGNIEVDLDGKLKGEKR